MSTFRGDGEVEEVITRTTVRTRDTVFPLFGGAGTKSATDAELQVFGESVREDEVAKTESCSPSRRCRDRRSGKEPRTWRGNAKLTCREHTDPEELRRRAAEASADVPR